MTLQINSLRPATQEIERALRFFGSEMEGLDIQLVPTIQSRGRGRTMNQRQRDELQKLRASDSRIEDLLERVHQTEAERDAALVRAEALEDKIRPILDFINDGVFPPDDVLDACEDALTTLTATTPEPTEEKES